MKQIIPTFEEFIKEQQIELLFEMPNIHHWEKLGKIIGLPMNIWFDDKKAYISGKHGKRTKFQKDTHPRMTNEDELISISTVSYKVYQKTKEIDLNKNLPKDFDISKKDIENFIIFMKNHKDVIDLLMDKVINFDHFTDIIENNKKIKEYDGSPIKGDKYEMYNKEKSQIEIISNNNRKILAKKLSNGEIICFIHHKDNKYFKEGTDSVEIGKKIHQGNYEIISSKERNKEYYIF